MKKTKFIFCLALVLTGVLVGLCGASSAFGDDLLQHRFEQIAHTNTHFSLTVITRNRPLRLWTGKNPLANDQIRLAQELRSLSDDRANLAALLKHPNPKVRTLALGAVFEREDGHDLPLIATLLDDAAATFPDLHESMNSAPGPRPMVELESPQSVGMVAEALLKFWGIQHQGRWLIRSEGGSKIITTNDFAIYWESHRNRDYCAGWFGVKLARACRSTSPTQREYIADILKVRHQIDQLPADDRAWILLWLFGEYGSDQLTTENELLELAKQLGSERLMLMLQRKIPCTDPDLQPRDSNNWPYKRMTLFVLKNASQLLKSEDADKLLACRAYEADQNRHGGLGDPTDPQWWAVAAAYLQPAMAKQILHTAFDNIQGRDEYHAEMRADLAVALWDVCGESEGKFLVNWFYQEFPSKQLWVNWRRSFIENVSAVKQPSPKKLISRLVKDSRCKSMDWDVASLQSLANVINGWLGEPAVPQHDIDAIQMDETSKLKRQLLENLRASVRQWNK